MSSVLLRSKRVVTVGVGSKAERDEERVLLVIEGDGILVSGRTGLTREEAEVFAEGVLEGLRLAGQGYFMDEADPAAATLPPSQYRH